MRVRTKQKLLTNFLLDLERLFVKPIPVKDACVHSLDVEYEIERC